ncbi:MAG: hypothetical protein IMX02_08280 [Limnochordaceae bacterium]|nr:hypothetical protein [Limnochordaceae bacterium]
MGKDLYAIGHPTFEQQLRLRMEGKVATGVTVSADLDNIKSENLQLIGIDVTWGPSKTHLGDIRVQGQSTYAVSQATVKGADVALDLGSMAAFASGGYRPGDPGQQNFLRYSQRRDGLAS